MVVKSNSVGLFKTNTLTNYLRFRNFALDLKQHNLIYAEMPNHIVYAEVEDNFVMSQNEEVQEDIFSSEQNPDLLSEDDKLLNSELDKENENIGFEDDNNYYGLRDNTHNDSKLLIALTIGTLISLGILVNSMLS